MSSATRSWVLLILTLCLSAAHAERNSKQRLAVFARLPDWSGVWERFNIGVSDLPSNPDDLEAFKAAYMEVQPPYNAEWQSKHDAEVRVRKAPQPRCQPLGFPGAMLFPSDMMQIIVTPEETTVLFYSGGARHIATAGQQHPAQDELWASLWGDSIGHWEGQVLVVDTVASNAPIMGRDGPLTLSSQAHTVERIRMPDANTLEDQMTITDAVALTRPWSFTLKYHRVPGMVHLIESDCQENDRNPVIDGSYTVAPPKSE
jgi:hypothetical protein